MKYLIFSLLFSTFAFADTYTNGYYKANGTYVQGYWKSSPNNTKLDNYSTKGNYNPYKSNKGIESGNTIKQGASSNVKTYKGYGGY